MAPPNTQWVDADAGAALRRHLQLKGAGADEEGEDASKTTSFAPSAIASQVAAQVVHVCLKAPVIVPCRSQAGSVRVVVSLT